VQRLLARQPMMACISSHVFLIPFFSLTARLGGIVEGQIGTLAVRFARMVCQFSADTMPAPQMLPNFGPYRDNTGLGDLTFQIMEEFA